MLPRAHTGEQPFEFAVRRLSGTSQTGLSVLRQQSQEQAKEEGGDEGREGIQPWAFNRQVGIAWLYSSAHFRTKDFKRSVRVLGHRETGRFEKEQNPKGATQKSAFQRETVQMNLKGTQETGSKCHIRNLCGGKHLKGKWDVELLRRTGNWQKGKWRNVVGGPQRQVLL